MSPIKDVQTRYRELGRLRMGEVVESGGKKRPGRLETWRLTSPAKTLLEHAAGLWGGGVEVWEGAPTEGEQFELVTEVSALAVIVPPQDIDSNSWYELWSAGGVRRRCDGETDMISGRACFCANKETRECKPTTYLKVMLPEIPDIGTWRLVTRGWNAAAELTQVVRLLNRLSPNLFAEGVLRIESRTSKAENAKGAIETHHFTVPVLELPFSMGELMQHAPAELVAGPRGRVPLPGDAPALPEDSRFEHDREQDAAWGEPAPAIASEPEARGEKTLGEVAEGSEDVSGAGGTDSSPASAVPEAPSLGEPLEAREIRDDQAPPEDPSMDSPAPDRQWKLALSHGITGPKALVVVRKLYEQGALKGTAPASQSALTKGELAKVIETVLGG